MLPNNPTLKDYQLYVAKMEQERGFKDQCSLQKCLLLGEELGELFKAIRQREGIKMGSQASEVAMELADILIYLCAIANRYDIDLELAFREKEVVNKRREWT